MTREGRLATVLAMNLALVGALIGVGLTAHSLGVLAAGGDYLADAAAIAVSLLAIWLSRRPRSYPRATAIAALINGGWLLMLSAFVASGAIARLASRTPKVEGLSVLIVSGVACAVMVVGAVVLGGAEDDDDGGDSLNMRAVVLDTVADAATAGGVAVTGAVILASGSWFWLDPAVALIIALVVGVHALNLVRQVVRHLKAEPPDVVDATKDPCDSPIQTAPAEEFTE